MKKARRKKTKNQKKIRKIRKIFRIFEKTNFRKHTISNFCTVEYEQCCIPIDFNPNISEIKAFSGILSEKSSQPKKKRSSQPGQVGQVQRSDLAVHLAYGKTQPGQPDLAQQAPLIFGIPRWWVGAQKQIFVRLKTCPLLIYRHAFLFLRNVQYVLA